MAKDLKQLVEEYLRAQKSGTSEDVKKANQQAKTYYQQRKAEREDKKETKPGEQAQSQNPGAVIGTPAATVSKEEKVPDLQ